jgi:membrane protease YdiL (CAAX protease family)
VRSIDVFYVVLLFPLIAGVGWGVVKPLLSLRYRERAGVVMMRQSGWLHLAFLSIPTLVVLDEGRREGTLAAMGLRWPEVAPLPAWLGGPLVLLAAVAVGLLLYVNELALSAQVRRLLARDHRAPVRTLVQGQSAALGALEAPPMGSFMAASALISFAEELVWRGFLVYWLATQWGLPLWQALVVPALLFGVNHAYFGLRSVVLKAIDGVVWGLLLVLTSSILAPFVSHLTFQYLVWRRLDRRQRTASLSSGLRAPAAAGGFRA